MTQSSSWIKIKTGRKTMKKVIALISVMVLISLPLIAHPPSDIVITYNLATKSISVIVEHAVKAPAEHFVHEAVVKVNGKKVLEQFTLVQDSVEGQVFTYTLPGLKEGDTVTVMGDCNKFGSLEKSVVIKAQETVKPKPASANRPK
jgi:hypothetical protein